MRTFFTSLTGANCRLGDQALISLSVTEDIDADYDTASAVTIAPGGPFTKGSYVSTVEGGVTTGLWVVEDPVINRSGAKTWRRRVGAGYTHVPLVAYRLRRAGYLQGRSTLSKSNPKIGADHYPPRFCSWVHWGRITAAIDTKLRNGEIDNREAIKQRNAWRPVYNAEYIAAQICSWVGMPIRFDAHLDVCADEYQPVDKPAMTALREVASWSGRSVFLDRNGVIRIFDWPELFSRGGSVPLPAAVLEEEIHDSLYPISHVTVVGHGYATGGYWVPGDPGGPRLDPRLPPWRDAQPGYWRPSNALVAIEITESLAGPEAACPTIERIEINDYPITPTIAQRIARERLARVALAAGVGKWRGPATAGSSAIHPLSTKAFTVNRTLDWTGNGYRYEIEITAPRSSIGWGSGGWNASGWW
jgi:hypothetical protein